MKNTFALTVSLLLFCSLALLFGCGKKSEFETQTGSEIGNSLFPSSREKGSDMPNGEPKPVKIDEKELSELIKVALQREYFREFTYEVSEVAVEWMDKDVFSYLGNYTAVIKAKEKMYEEISNREGRRELLEDEYEGKLKIANEKAKTLPEPHKSQMLNSYPTDDLRQFEFYKLVQPKGGEQTIRGSVEMTREHQDDPFKVTSVSKRTPIESMILESELSGKASRMDDGETREVLEKIVKKRKQWVEEVDRRLEEIHIDNQKKEAEWTKKIAESIYPGAKYEGISNDHEMNPTPHKIIVEFGDYEMPDQSQISGRYYNPDAKGVVTTFSLPLGFTGDVNADLVGPLREHFNPQGLKRVPGYYRNTSGYTSPIKVHFGLLDDKILFRVGEIGAGWGWFRGELKSVAKNKSKEK